MIQQKTTSALIADVKRITNLDCGLLFGLNRTGSVSNRDYQVIVCYYGDLQGYTVKWAVEILVGEEGHQVYRANVMR